ncbi:MAG: putative electron transport protein YccM [Verrucomicrobiota bacterium]
MNIPVEAVLTSWNLAPGPLLGLVASGAVYLRGWRRLAVQVPERFPVWRCGAFLAGLLTLFVAIASPVDAFAGWLLSVHMVQHLLLTMVAPPLLLLGTPYLPMLCGLPRGIPREIVGPILTSRPWQRVVHRLTHPAMGLVAFVGSNLLWHLPVFYGLGLRSEAWHRWEHACFLATALWFWFPVIQPWPARLRWPRWAMIPYLLAADLQNTALGAVLSFADRILYPAYGAAPRVSSWTPLEDQALAGALMWVPGSIAFLVPLVWVVVEVLEGRRGVRPGSLPGMASRVRRGSPLTVPIQAQTSTSGARVPWDLLEVPVVGRVLRQGWFRRGVQGMALLAAVGVVVDGFWGPPVASANLAGVVPWLVWRGLWVVVLLALGNLFCFGCPLMLVRDGARRILPARWPWPRWLRGKWVAGVLLAGFLAAAEAFSWWDRPVATAVLIGVYFVLAVGVDGLFRGASFCRHVCPIGFFGSIQALSSPLTVAVRNPEACSTCTTHDCLRGNAEQRGCEVGFFLPRKSGNLDCTGCLDCVRACPESNVGVLAVNPFRDRVQDRVRSVVGRYAQRPDVAVGVLVSVASAWVSMAVMVMPVPPGAGLGLPPTLGTLWVFLGGIVSLGGLAGMAGALGAAVLSPGGRTGLRWTTENVIHLAPMGFGLWAAHWVAHLGVGLPLLGPILQRCAAEGLGMGWPVGFSGLPLAFRESLPWVQVLLVDAGFLAALWSMWTVAGRWTSGSGSRWRAFLPWGVLATLLHGMALWLLLQPMPTRGTPGQGF